MVLSNSKEETLHPSKPIHVSGNSETLICNRCGAAYLSRGKFDPGYCRECEMQYGKPNDVFIGGPLHGERIG